MDISGLNSITTSSEMQTWLAQYCLTPIDPVMTGSDLGTILQKIINTSVASVNGQTGAISLTSDDIGEGSTNKYFTNARVATYGDSHYVKISEYQTGAIRNQSDTAQSANFWISGQGKIDTTPTDPLHIVRLQDLGNYVNTIDDQYEIYGTKRFITSSSVYEMTDISSNGISVRGGGEYPTDKGANFSASYINISTRASGGSTAELGTTSLQFKAGTLGDGTDNGFALVPNIAAPRVGGSYVITMPAASGTIALTSDITALDTSYAKLTGGNTFNGYQTIENGGLTVGSNEFYYDGMITIAGVGILQFQGDEWSGLRQIRNNGNGLDMSISSLVHYLFQDDKNIAVSDGNSDHTQYFLKAKNTAPSSSTDTGSLYEMRIVGGYLYVCTATNTWVRTALSTF